MPPKRELKMPPAHCRERLNAGPMLPPCSVKPHSKWDCCATAILDLVDDPAYRGVYVITDDDMPWFNQAAQTQTRTTLATALKAMPDGYKGPVAFQSDYTSQQPDGSPARPTNSSNPDWKNTLGTFSYQASGIATPTLDGHYAVAARTSIYDYYNYETTDPNRYGLPQPSDLNMLHRAGWAQNFDTVGTSSTQTSTYP